MTYKENIKTLIKNSQQLCYEKTPWNNFNKPCNLYLNVDYRVYKDILSIL